MQSTPTPSPARANGAQAIDRLTNAVASALVALAAVCALGTAVFTAAPTRAQTPAQSAPVALHWQDFFVSPIGAQGLVLGERLRQAQGKPVRISGYMVQQESGTPGQFLLTPRPVLMSQHADGEADDLPPATVFVALAPEQQDRMVAYTRGVIEITGVLDLGRQEGPDGRVSWVRLQLPADSTRAMNGLEYLTYRHSLQHLH